MQKRMALMGYDGSSFAGLHLRNFAEAPSGSAQGVSGQGRVWGAGVDDYGMLGERFRIVGRTLSLKILFQSSGAWHQSFGSWPRILGLARNVESLTLGGLLFSWEPRCRWISGRLSAATHDRILNEWSSCRPVPTCLEEVFQCVAGSVVALS